VLDYLGSSTTKNGVLVSFGSLQPGELGATSSSHSIKLDMKQIEDGVSKAGDSLSAEVGATGVHEGTHGRDLAKGIFSNIYDPKHPFLFWAADVSEEERAFRNGSLIYEGLGVSSSSSGLWNMSWKEADRDTLRTKAVRDSAINDATQVSIDAATVAKEKKAQ